jgi:hypothetical protein
MNYPSTRKLEPWTYHCKRSNPRFCLVPQLRCPKREMWISLGELDGREKVHSGKGAQRTLRPERAAVEAVGRGKTMFEREWMLLMNRPSTSRCPSRTCRE